MYNKEKDKTASEYRAIALEHKEALETNKRIFVKSGVYVVLIAIILIIISIAWFVMNNRVESVTSTISAIGNRYVVVTGSDGDKPGWWEQIENWVNGDKPVDFNLSDSMNVNNHSNLKNISQTSTLSPGSSGKLAFTVDPIAKDLGNIKVTIDINVDFRENNNPSKETKDKLEEIIKGHILFFEGKTSDDLHYQNWIGPNENGSYEFIIENDSFLKNGETSKSFEKTVYWVWPNQIHNLIYTGDGIIYKNLLKSYESVDYRNLNGDINENKSKYFWNDTELDENIDSDMGGTLYQKCTDNYNLADQNIGQYIEFIQVRFTTEEVSGG